ncbi:DUF1361 domain-containing protein [Nodosilinea sp. LEGE 06152]|uniref:DUF1361 domain-containing protein n=1 Tax=Nodosilinea sp. LEGE 06152 TaxID=2777966 RepID=UPI00187E143B|nr:DUF1361 domain-containing protein [Nodosilinea sp. LEGE 06152]MBE9159567.1 DUF1361 domain-containing protein [Nodosilinea sp. LEGE 06152]
MRWLLPNIISAFDNVYSGWILWNLFLAAIPLLLSFSLFRRQSLANRWFLAACVLVGIIGVLGLGPRIPRAVQGLYNLLRDNSGGGLLSLLELLWLLLVAAFAGLLSLKIFKTKQNPQGWLWWVGLVVFLVFLPNAPYVLTDIIHLIRGTSSGEIRILVVALVFIPLHAIAILLGFEAYVVSILNLAAYLKQHGAKAMILPLELTIHALSAVGIYLGRFLRFNSWDLVIDPTGVIAYTLDALTSKQPAAVIFVTFVILTSLYWVMKQITLGLKLRIRYARQGIDALD